MYVADDLSQYLANKLSFGGRGGRGFITEWTVSVGDLSVTLPLVNTRAEGALVYDCTVDWGDGSTSTITAYDDADVTHNYASAGTYQITIKGTCEGWSFNNLGSRLKIRKVIHWGDKPVFAGFKYLRNGFRGCSNLSQLGTGAIPASGTGILTEGFTQTFYNCSSLTSLPSSLFREHTSMTSEAFYYCFYGCTGLLSIPEDLFSNNVSIGATAFYGCFISCIGLTSVPANLFKNNTAVGLNAFRATFNNCIGLTTIPADLFRYNTLATSFRECFAACSGLETLPADLFRYNTLATSFQGVFDNCQKLQQRADIFFPSGGETTRFLNMTINFTYAFRRTTFSGTQGVAPALWDCNFGTGTPMRTDCWEGAGNSLTSLSNYGDIPADWI